MGIRFRLKIPMAIIAEIWLVIKDAAVAWHKHNAMRLAAALAFYTIFSLAPALLIALSVAAAFVGQAAAWSELSGQLERQLGLEVASFVVATLQTWGNQRDGTLATMIGIGIMLFGATVVFTELKSALNEIWNAEAPSGGFLMRILHARLLSFVAVLGVGFLLLLSVLVSTAVSTVNEFLAKYLPIPGIVLQGTNFGVAFLLMTVLFATLYKALPDVDIALGDVWVGALITSGLLMIGKFLIGFYLRNWVLSSVYGAAGSLVILLAWVYYSSMVVFFGAELTRAYAVRREGRASGQ